ncbi:hypothetical protein M4951_15765 [Blastopirellula sp. J2-11]|uniref:hypothetical protein n=1 Tax=Blastopirellula sp. J2-11 TaxID=2943192 RepID=UPI0021C5B018|nr:hypothetical protein [Blastopirellula sp. J2-11]UUO04842.1 hypothetical protein M4951_15765 [Blastopirellula sp. J2-11]
MKIDYICPKCEAPGRVAVEENCEQLTCPHCQAETRVPNDAIQDERLSRCMVCPSRELYVRKDFPQWLGVLIVAVGIGLSCVTWYYHQVILTFVILFGSALLDMLLLLVVGNQLKCYRCGAEYRNVPGIDSHHPFDLETHERHRQQAARLGKQPPSA